MALDKYLAIYLNDHLAALGALRDVARRSRRSNEGSVLGRYLEDVAAELEESRARLGGLTLGAEVEGGRGRRSAPTSPTT